MSLILDFLSQHENAANNSKELELKIQRENDQFRKSLG